VPYQRAFLFFHEGAETLVLQSKYKLPRSAGADSLGWVVPVPAVPELASIDAAMAKHFFRELSFRTQPKPNHISTYFLMGAIVLFLGALAFLLVCLMEYPFLSRMKLSRTMWHRPKESLAPAADDGGVRGMGVIRQRPGQVDDAVQVQGPTGTRTDETGPNLRTGCQQRALSRDESCLVTPGRAR